jgi:cold shock CspA family protein
MKTANQPPVKYFRGTVRDYSKKSGFGFIAADEDLPTGKRLLVHSKSLRRSGDLIESGDRVIFTTRQVATGTLAVDVHPELVDRADIVGELTEGTVERFDASGQHGTLALKDGRTAFFHASYFVGPDPIRSGLVVWCTVVATAKGLQAQNISIQRTPQSPAPSVDYLAQATLARDEKRYDDAARLYETGLRRAPSVQLILSYAAMEKNRGRKTEARRIYEAGIRVFPDMAKLREDAGVLAHSQKDNRTAILRLEEALDLCRSSRQGGEKGVLLWLARTHYQIGSTPSLRECIRRYHEAQHLFGRGPKQLPPSDLLTLNLAKIRTQHHRGNLAFTFVTDIGFEIVRATLLERTTEGADLIVEVTNPELQESYGVGRFLLIRCVFKSDVTLADLEDIDINVAKWSRDGLADDQLALLIVSSLPQELQHLLSQRIEDRRRLSPAIVPLQQSEIETSGSPMTALRASLDRWLYRRDLFATNSPVEGRRFFGRDKPLSELRDSIAAGVPVGVFGLRKVGKTSLLKEAQRRSAEMGDLVLYLDLSRVPSDVSDCRWIYWKLATELREQATRLPLQGLRWRLGGEFADFLDIPASFPVATAFDSDVTRLLQCLRAASFSPRPRIVFLLDEIERLLPNNLGKVGFEGFFEFFSYLRGVSQENREFVVTVTGANAAICEAAQFQGRDNPVFNYFKEIYLQLLEYPECATMVRELGRGMGIRFDTTAVEAIYDATGGHPFFTRQFCSFLAHQYPERPLIVTRNMLQPLIAQYLSVRSNDFAEIVDRLERDFPDELAICVALARDGGAINTQNTKASFINSPGVSVRHLIGYQILQVEPTRAFIKISMLSQWLQLRYGTHV